MSRVRVPSIALFTFKYPMSPFEAFILGLIQGLAEFLPISSSGHLELGQHFLGYKNLDQYVFFNLICHLGTLLALIIVFVDKIKAAFLSKTLFLQVVIGTLPLFPLVLILKPLKSMFDQPQYLGFCFLITACLLYVSQKLEFKIYPSSSLRGALTVGLFQAVAILPGISRSGATISGARLIGWNKEDAMSFAFLLAIPAILGGVTLEMMQIAMGKTTPTDISAFNYFIGFISSFVFGLLSLKVLMKVAEKNKFIYFVWYLGILGLITSTYFNLF